MKDKTNRSRQARHREKLREAGFVQVLVWVPVDDKPRVIRYVERLRKARGNGA